MFPQVSRYVIGQQICPITEVRWQLHCLTYGGFVWNPYEVHHITRLFQSISLFSIFIRLGGYVHRHLPERVLQQYGYQQTILRSANAVDGYDLGVTDARWFWLKRQSHFLVLVVLGCQLNLYFIYLPAHSHPNNTNVFCP